MPFTFSHPAIILPLTYLPKRWYSLTGLVIGSLTPDFEYFLRMYYHSGFSHSYAGLVLFDLPLGVLLAFLFHGHVRDPLFDNLPFALRSRLAGFKLFDWTVHFKQHWPVVLGSILLGAVSHVGWDSFTHVHGFFADHFPAYNSATVVLGKHMVPLRMVSRASTLLGAAVLGYALFRLPKDGSVQGLIEPRYWTLIIGLVMAIVILRFDAVMTSKLVGHLAVTTISAFLIGLVVSPLILRWSGLGARGSRN